MAAMSCPHARQHGFDAFDEAEDIGVEHLAHRFVLAFLDRGKVALAGIVQQHIGVSEPGMRLRDRILN